MDALQKSVKDICNNYYKYLLSLQNVHGVGYGFKYINNLNTFKPCIYVFVENKIPKKYISFNNLIPKDYMGIQTDVIKASQPKLKRKVDSIVQKFRPLKSGAGISIESLDISGTLGCIVTKPYYRYFKQYFILSNNHVLADSNKQPIGAPIFQPKINIGGVYKDNIVATLENYIPLNFMVDFENIDNPPVNYVDCAIAKILNSSLVSNKIYELGEIRGVGEINLNAKVRKVGAVSGLTEGYIKTQHLSEYIIDDDNEDVLFFKELIACDLKNENGDSGAIIVNIYNEVLGLLFAGTENLTYMNDINLVLSKLNVSLYTG